MKVTHRILAALFAATVLSPLGAQEIKINLDKPTDAKNAKPAATAPAPAAGPAVAAPAVAPQFTQEQKLEALGWFMARQMNLDKIDFTQEEAQALAKGMFLVALRKTPNFDMDAIGPQAQAVYQEKMAVVQARAQKALEEVLAANKQANTQYVADLEKRPEVQKSSTGLRYEIILKGTGPKPKVEQTAKIHFTGKTLNGQIFASTAGSEPIEIVLANVIPGWKEGIQLLNQGGKIRLHVPPELAWGDRGSEGVLPGAFVVFDIDLLEVKDTPKEEPKK